MGGFYSRQREIEKLYFHIKIIYVGESGTKIPTVLLAANGWGGARRRLKG